LLDSNVDQFDNPDEVMKWLNDKLIKLFPVFQFATMFYGVIDFNNNELNYSTSSTTSPIIFKNNCSEYKIIDGKGFPLGVTQNADFKCKKIEFDKNDILVLYSDALIEAVMENGEGFGTKRLIDLLNKSFKRGAGKDMSVALNFVLNEFHSQCGSLLEDDLTVNFYKRIS
jgi:sigma-B regulation protein RsbU (phosphoserine phosphatase)